MNRIEGLVDDVDLRMEYRAEVLRRFRRDGCMIPAQLSRAASCIVQRGQPRPEPVNSSFWFGVGYHPWWYRSLRKAVTRFNKDLSFSDLVRNAKPNVGHIRVNIAWKNSLPATSSLIQRS